ncbi:MAG TPA: hypothetical protein PKD55_14140 [Bellilinea sp.]|nr:hypothetical protein [Bellilinea sp.]
MDERLIGKWKQPETQTYPGLWFDFHADGTFTADYEPMAIKSGGTYETKENGVIDVDQTSHTFGLVGKFLGLYEIDGSLLKLNLVSAEGHDRPANLTGAVLYERME